MAFDSGTITSASPWAALSQKLKDLISGGSGVANWSFVENVPAGTGVGQSGATTYSLDVFRCRGASTLYSRVGNINLANFQSTTDGTAFVATITTPAASRVQTVTVINTKASSADDPTSVALDGSNAPTFTKIKSQASGNSGEVKITVWIGKSTASAPTGTQLTASFGATQTGCIMIVDDWIGLDTSLGVTGIDATGVAQVVVQAVGNNGTNEASATATLGAYLGNQSVAYAVAANNAGGAFTAEAGWRDLTQADSTFSTPTTHGRGAFRPATVISGETTDTSVNFTMSAGTSWACVALELQRSTITTSIINANDAGRDWYYIIEIPVPDGAVSSLTNSCEDYDGNKLFRRMPPSPTTLTPVGSGGWRSDTLTQYASVTGNNRSQLAHQALNTSGFSYWIKLTNNGVMISSRVGATEAMSGAMLLDSFITSATDHPLINVNAQVALGNSMSRIPGLTGVSVPSNAFQTETRAWTTPVNQGITTNAASSSDLWSSSKIHVARIFVAHSPANTSANAFLYGYAKGLWKTDFLCFTRGGTVQIGDTMSIAGNTWTVMSNSSILLGTGAALVIVTRAT